MQQIASQEPMPHCETQDGAGTHGTLYFPYACLSPKPKRCIRRLHNKSGLFCKISHHSKHWRAIKLQRFFFFLLQRKNTNLDSNTYRDPRIHSCAEQVTDAREMGWLLPTFLSIKPEACHLQEAAWSCVSRGRTGASPSIHNSLPMNYPLGFPPLT